MNMKRLVSLFLALTMILSMLMTVGCQPTQDGGDGADGQGNDGSGDYVPTPDPIDDNYRTFYQILVGSFSDSNNDGIGDLRGVINRMDYLNDGDITKGDDLGVQGIWLSPIFSSPSSHKYDTDDYYEIDWRYGMEADLVELLEICHERNVKVILDLAINHTSDKHPWFKEFKKAREEGDTSNKYYYYYDCVTNAQKDPNSIYGKVPGVDCFYLCNFFPNMPELNLDSPEVREEVLNIAKYYMELGVDGFRFDAVKHIYDGRTSKNVSFWEWYMNELRTEYPRIYAVGECWSGDDEVISYYKAFDCFNFTLAQSGGLIASTAKGQKISNYTNYIENYQNRVEGKNSNGMVIPFVSNHDVDRIAETFGNTAATAGALKMVANLMLLTPGSPVIYYGDELGMRGSREPESDSDSNRRLAMLWGDDDYIRDPAGASYPSSKQIKSTVASQLKSNSSMLRHYQQVIALRHKYAAIARGDYNSIYTDLNKYVGGFYIKYEGEVLGLLHNTSPKSVSIDVTKLTGLDGNVFETLCDCVGGDAKLVGNILTIDAYTSVILK